MIIEKVILCSKFLSMMLILSEVLLNKIGKPRNCLQLCQFLVLWYDSYKIVWNLYWKYYTTSETQELYYDTDSLYIPPVMQSKYQASVIGFGAVATNWKVILPHFTEAVLRHN